jgi:hypothetical protein
VEGREVLIRFLGEEWFQVSGVGFQEEGRRSKRRVGIMVYRVEVLV